MTMTARELVEQAIELGLLEAADLDDILSPVAAGRTDDAKEVARRLVHTGRLTRFQVAAIYQGQGRSLALGEYRVVDRLGAGGMGHVFQARQLKTNQVVAIKVVSQSAMKNADGARRFEREVKAAARLTHPNVVRAFDSGVHDGRHYLVMEFIDGTDLSALVKREGRLSIEQACDFVAQAARGIAYAHGEGIVHRDIKPGNLLVDRGGTVKVLDLGLARFDGPEGEPSDGELTQHGAVLGTVDYMAPEQALNTRHADAKSDVYGLGCTLYRLLTGETPYGGDTLVEKVLAHRNHPIPMLRGFRPDAPAALEALVAAMLAKRPEERPSMQEVAHALATIKTAAPARPGDEIVTAPFPTPLNPPLPIAVPAEPGNAFAPPMSTAVPMATLAVPLAAETISASPGRASRSVAAASATRRNFAVLVVAVAIGAIAGIYAGIHVLDRFSENSRIAEVEEPADGGGIEPGAAVAGVAAEPHDALDVPGTAAGPRSTAPAPPQTTTTIPVHRAPSRSIPTPPKPSAPKPNSKPIAPAATGPATATSTPRPAAASSTAPAPRPSAPAPAPSGPLPPSLSEVRRTAIDAGLEWLARCQQPQGNWTFAVGPDGPENSTYDAGNAATALAVLVFLRAGHLPRQGTYGKEIDRGLTVLLNRQERTGKGTFISGNWWNGDKGTMYTHALATLAVIEAAKATKLKDARYLSAARLAVRFIVLAQDRNGGGWRYNPGEPGDLSVTGWQVQALKGFLDLKIPNEPTTEVIEKSLALFEKSFLPTVQLNDGRRYRYMNEGRYGENSSMSAAGLSTVLELGAAAESPLIQEGAGRLLAERPTDLPYMNYYKTRLLQQIGGAKWSAWDEQITRDLAAKQQMSQEFNLRGSWKPNAGELVGKSGGRFACTAFNLLILLFGQEDDSPS